MALFGSLLSAGIGFLSNRSAARSQERAARQAAEMAQQGGNYLQQNLGGVIQGGTQAFDMRNALLGVGGDEDAARAAFDNYLGSTGFDFAMRSGQDAISGSRAARGVLNSGRTGTALTEFGQNLGRRAFGEYFSQLGEQSGAGINAAINTGSVMSGAGAQAGNVTMQGAGRAADYRQQGWQDLAGGIGAASTMWNQRRQGG